MERDATFRQAGPWLMGLALIGTLGVVGTVDGMFTEGPAWLPFGFAGICLMNVLFVVRVRVVATASELIVRNPLHTHKVAWADIDSFACGRRFLMVRLKDGERLPCVAVPRSGASQLLGRRGADERIRDELERRRLAANSGSSSGS